MSTSYNTSIKLYTGVPLVKGGTEVLYLSQGAAEGVLAPFLKATYNDYYFARDNRRAVQIDATFGECDDVNYISFANKSHGGKIFFGFVDEIVYINDNCTEIRYTIDPFPTYLGDTDMLNNVFVVRNTYKNPTRTSNFIIDYVPQSVKKYYTNIYHTEIGPANGGVCYFAGGGHDYVEIQGTGILVGQLTQALVERIHTNGGIIIGAYLDFLGGTTAYYEPVQARPDITFNPLSGGGLLTPKLRTGVYNDLILNTSSGSKQYDIEDFADPESVTFGQLFCVIPSPMLFIYPKNYRGVANNVGEGVTVKVPSLPIAANATYTDAQFVSDARNVLVGALGGAFAGYLKGGAAGAAVGGIAGAAGGVGNMLYNDYATQFKAPQIIGRGEPMLSTSKTLVIDFIRAWPANNELNAINNYLNYYGYQVNSVMSATDVNTDNNAFLQTGSEFLHGSEADTEINARITAGIKIKKTL